MKYLISNILIYNNIMESKEKKYVNNLRTYLIIKLINFTPRMVRLCVSSKGRGGVKKMKVFDYINTY